MAVISDDVVALEPLQRALSLYRRRYYKECAEICEGLGRDVPQAQWLQLRATTSHGWLDELELDVEPLAQTLLDDQV